MSSMFETPFDPPGEPPPPPPEGYRTAIGIILAVAAASLLYRILKLGHLEHTSLVFIGIPTVLAILTVRFVPRPRTITGVILKAITVALLVSGVALGEGFICIVMASPLFILVGVIIGKIAESRYWRYTRRGRRILSVTAFSMLSVSSLEGVLPGFNFSREETVTVVRVVDRPASQVEASLSRTPRFDAPLPLFFRARFPRPAAASGSGLAVGDTRAVRFTAAGHYPGALVMRISRSAPGSVTFTAVSDDSYIKHWLTWEGADVSWSAVDGTHTRVSWTVRYRRTLDPAWYFKPWERYGARLAAGYLIVTAAAGS